MRLSCLFIVLALGALASAQDRASLDRFAKAYDHAEQTGDGAWFMAHLDEKGTVGSGKNRTTAAQQAKMFRAMKGKPMPVMASASKTTIDKASIAGTRAVVDYTTRMTTKAGGKRMAFKGHAVMLWKKGDWRILSVDTKPLP